MYEILQNVELVTEDCSPQDDNENENILDHENVDDKGGIDAMYDYTLNNFRILTNIRQDNIINSNIGNLNQKQREVFDIINKWTIDRIKHLSSAIKKQLTPFYMLMLGAAGVSKSHVLKKFIWLSTSLYCIKKWKSRQT